jgi:hypothetical protein
VSRFVAVLVLFVLVVVGAAAWRSHEQPVATTTSSTSTSTSTSTSSTTSSTVVSACASDQFTGRLEAGQGATGTIYDAVVLTNTSSSTCTITGWPVLTLYKASGSPLANAVIIDATTGFEIIGSVPSSPVTFPVAPGGNARFELAFSDVPVGSQDTCPTVNHLDVQLPGDSTPTDALVVSGGGFFAPCGQPQVRVSPYFPG